MEPHSITILLWENKDICIEYLIFSTHIAMYSTSFVGYFIWKGTIYNINISVAIQGIVPELA